MPDVVIVGSGPNGLSAAVRLAQAGASVLVLEAAGEIGGGTRTAELTLPGFRHDDCSGAHPLGILPGSRRCRWKSTACRGFARRLRLRIRWMTDRRCCCIDRSSRPRGSWGAMPKPTNSSSGLFLAMRAV